MSKIYTAAIIVIGNEILSGRTKDKNINYLANKLVKRGIALLEVRVIPDVQDVIISTLHETKDKFTYVFTTGGIGPTHDDITSLSVAKAFDVPLVTNKEAYSLLEDRYGADDFTQPRRKMAHTPKGAELIPNPVSVAPGFIIDNVYVMAGVPVVMQAMVDHVIPTLKGGEPVLSNSVPSRFPESVIAEGLGDIQDKYQSSGVDIGSYPYFRDGHLGVNVVVRASDKHALVLATKEVELMISIIEEDALSED